MGWGTSNIKSKRSRATMPVSTKKVYMGLDQRGLSLGYRKNAKEGTWSFRRYANGRYQYHVPNAVADDEGEADSETILSYQQAVAAAIKWNDEQAKVDIGEVVIHTHTVKDAVEKYIEDKEREKRKSLYRDTKTAEANIYPALGAIQLRKLTHTRLKEWRDGLASA